MVRNLLEKQLNDPLNLDRLDRSILSILAQDGRISITDLASRIGLSKSPTQARLRRLESTGVIMGYRALLDPITLGLDHVAFVEFGNRRLGDLVVGVFFDAFEGLPRAVC